MKKNTDTNVVDEEPEEEYYEEEASFSSEVRKYATMVIGGLVVVAVIVLGTIAYFDGVAEESAEAATALSRVTSAYYQGGDYANALTGGDATVRGEKVLGLKEIARKYESTEAGKLAALYAGQAFLMQNNFEEAATYFTMARSSDARVTQIGAEAGLAACKAQGGQLEEAAGLYEKASTLAEETGNSEPYQLFAAMLYEKAGKTDNALRLYRDIVAAKQFSEFSGEAKSGLVRLGATID